MEELELTYLIKRVPPVVLKSPSKNLLDIYIPTNSEHPSLRIRKSGDKHEITKKQPIVDGDASRQLETTIPLTKEEFEDLNKLKGKRVEKTRYYYKEKGIAYEVDVFAGELSGLILVDVEFPSVKEKSQFKMPAWCLIEVTQEKFIAGGMLCGKKYKDIEKKLQVMGYKKVVFS
jgi:CYTH domain-containing protein